MTIKEQCKKAVEEYTGVKVKSIQVIADPQVSGCYAMRAIMMEEVCDTKTLYFIKTHSDPITADTIEDAEFESWPPKSGELKFF